MKKDLILGEDYYIDKLGRWVFTKEYHLKRGYCCSPYKHPGCLHCPYRVIENDFTNKKDDSL
jgi:hypothetical protein